MIHRQFLVLVAAHLVTAALPSAAFAQQSYSTAEGATAVAVAVPPLATPNNVKTDVGETAGIGRGMADIINADLKSTSSFIVVDPKNVRVPSYPEITAPAYGQWQGANVKILVSGFVEARSDSRLMVGCYVYDVQKERELGRKGLLVASADWRRAAHKCADLAYSTVTQNGPIFDSRIAYVAQSGSTIAPVKRLAVMDFDGTNHAYLTGGEPTILTPRWSPGTNRIAYTAIADGQLQVQILDVATKQVHPLLPGGTSFAPAFAPDGQTLAVTIASDGNSDIYSVSANGTGLRRLTTSPAIDTDASFSPDGTKVVFASDRSGSQQLYVMNSDGSAQRRISFGGGDYGSPQWSPDGQRIAFTKALPGALRVGVMDADGSHERILSNGVTDESPTWGPSSEHILFARALPGTARVNLYSVSIDGAATRPVLTPQSGTDPSWVARER